jgi:hypothetical protein
VYVYQSNLFCNQCGESLREIIKNSGEIVPENPADENTYDSDHFPKGPYPDTDSADMPCHCAADEVCSNSVILDDGTKIGMPLGGLTKSGIQYVLQAMDTPLRRFWIKHHHIVLVLKLAASNMYGRRK